MGDLAGASERDSGSPYPAYVRLTDVQSMGYSRINVDIMSKSSN